MNSINTIFAFLEIASATSSGILAGALLTEANVLVPYWRKMSPRDFLSLHHQMGPSLFRFFAPITIAGTMLPIITSISAYLVGAENFHWWVASAILGLAMLGIYFGYFKAANESFETGSLKEAHVSTELSRWAYWHKLRTGLAVTGTVIALIAISSYR